MPTTRGAAPRSTCSNADVLVSITLMLSGMAATSSTGAAPLAGGTGPPSSTRATGPETATVSSAIPPKTE